MPAPGRRRPRLLGGGRRDDLAEPDRDRRPTTSRTRARKGARILTGGSARTGPGDWYEPTVIADADHSMKVMRDETFGPVVAGHEGAATPRRRSGWRTTPTTASAARCSRGDVEDGERIARRLEAGTVARQRPVRDQLLGPRRSRWAAGRTPGSATATARSASASSAAPSRSPCRACRSRSASSCGSRTAPRQRGMRQAPLPAVQRPRPAQPARASRRR